MNHLPDFMIIGAMKSATSTLYDQLVKQPGIFMSIPKEPNFFSDDEQYLKGIDWYKSLYKNSKESDILGEASTHYTKLPDYPLTLHRIKENNVTTKLIYVMRHPVDRLISHYMHEYSQGVITSDINDAVKKYDSLIEYGLYAKQLNPYINEFGLNSILPVFFDNLRINPQLELERICDFIGYLKEPKWSDSIGPSNVSSKRIKKFPFYDLVINSNISTFLRRTFVPKALRDKIKSSLTLNTRPELNPENLHRLENIFNADLKIIGELLGVNLNCSNFKDTTTKNRLEWKI